LQNESEAIRSAYERAFVGATDLDFFIDYDDRELVRSHLSALLTTDPDDEILDMCAGIGRVVYEHDVRVGSVDCIWKTYMNPGAFRITISRTWISNFLTDLQSSAYDAFIERVKAALEQYLQAGSASCAEQYLQAGSASCAERLNDLLSISRSLLDRKAR
jgi:hypothetical protein